MTVTRELRAPEGFDLGGTLRPLALSSHDPTVRIDGPDRARLALATADGSVRVRLDRYGATLRIAAVGELAQLAVDRAEDLLGLREAPPVFSEPRRLRALSAHYRGCNLPRTPVLLPRIVKVVLQQLVRYPDACRSWIHLVHRHGTLAPGDDELWTPPDARALAHLTVSDYFACGILPQHARRIQSVARGAARIEREWREHSGTTATNRVCLALKRHPGIGPWTLGYLRGTSMGDGDALVPQDHGFPGLVSHFFTGEREADDAEMERLLEPFRPHRFHVLWLIVRSGLKPGRRHHHRPHLKDRLRRYDQE